MMRIGDRAEIVRAFGATDVEAFAELAGIAEAGNQVPEPLIAALFSYLLGVRLPGPGTNYLKQELRFPEPAPLDEPLVASVEVTRLRPEKHLVDLATLCRAGNGMLIAEGRALVLVKDVD